MKKINKLAISLGITVLGISSASLSALSCSCKEETFTTKSEVDKFIFDDKKVNKITELIGNNKKFDTKAQVIQTLKDNIELTTNEDGILKLKDEKKPLCQDCQLEPYNVLISFIDPKDDGDAIEGQEQDHLIKDITFIVKVKKADETYLDDQTAEIKAANLTGVKYKTNPYIPTTESEVAKFEFDHTKVANITKLINQTNFYSKNQVENELKKVKLTTDVDGILKLKDAKKPLCGGCQLELTKVAISLQDGAGDGEPVDTQIKKYPIKEIVFVVKVKKGETHLDKQTAQIKAANLTGVKYQTIRVTEDILNQQAQCYQVFNNIPVIKLFLQPKIKQYDGTITKDELEGKVSEELRQQWEFAKLALILDKAECTIPKIEGVDKDFDSVEIEQIPEGTAKLKITNVTIKVKFKKGTTRSSPQPFTIKGLDIV